MPLKFTSPLSPAAFQHRCSEEKYWYHKYSFENGVTINGIYDIEKNIDEYEFGNLNRSTVLDVGPAAGWFSIYFNQGGARVTSVDVRGYSDYDVYGDPYASNQKCPSSEEWMERAQGERKVFVSPSGSAFWLMQELLGVEIEYYNSTPYELAPDLFGGRKFDIVFLGCVLMHLRDPIRALAAVRSICGERLIATAYCDPSLTPAEPVMALRNWSSILWWVPNEKCLREWFLAAGFRKVRLSSNLQLSVDTPYIDEAGHSHGKNQSLWKVEAIV